MANSQDYRGAFVQTGDPTTVNETAPYAKGQLGKEFSVLNVSASTTPGNTGSKVFKYVQVDSTATLAPYIGAVAWWSDRTTSKVTTAATNRGAVAGVFTGPFPQIGNFGCIQVGGPAVVKFIDAVTSTPNVPGLFVIPSATNGKADCLAAGSAATYPVLGITNSGGTGAYAWNPGDNTAEVDLKLNWTSNT